MKEDRITGKSKGEEILYSDLVKLSKEKNITVEAAKKELLNKIDKQNKDK
ncbi:MAG: hypothetical protein ABFS12_17990 [Bacteroidota bacterium]